MKMYFDPDAFDRIRESVSHNQRRCKLAVVDSFTMYILLQVYAKGERLAEHKTTLDVLRPTFSPANGRHKDKDMRYFLEILHGANMITYELNKREVSYRFVPSASVRLSKLGDPRKFVLIRECNRHIMEYYASNVPFAIYCLLRSLQRRENGITYAVRISFKEISRRLNISTDTLRKSKLKLEEDGYIFTIRGWNPDKGKCECNEYVLFDYDNKHAKRKPEKFEIFQMRRRQQKAKKDLSEQEKQKITADISEPRQETDDAFDWDI